MKQFILISLIYFLGAFDCCAQSSKDCEEKVMVLNSYIEIIEWLKSTSFYVKETINTSSSPWIRSANYYSCDGNKGYLILGFKTKEYVFRDIPYNIWIDFKKAKDFGKYYHDFIKGKYILKLK